MATGPKFQYAPVGNSNARNITNGSSNTASDYKVSIPPGSSHSLELVKHIYDYLLSNTAMWIHSAPEVRDFVISAFL